MIKLSDYVMKFIADIGVKHIFTLVGGGAMHLNDSSGHYGEIELVCNLHEQACSIAAEAYARVTNNIGIALVTTGPGGTNAITGVAGAWLDSIPCLIISGQVKRSDLKKDTGVRQLGVQEIDIISIVKTITKYAITIIEPDSIRYHMEKAVYLAKSGRPGPVWIDIPLDVQGSLINPLTLQGFDKKEIDVPVDNFLIEEQVEKTIELLNNADRPIILAGNGIRLSGANDNFMQLVELLNIPVLTTWPAMDIVPETFGLLVGRPGSIAPRGANFALQNSDWLLTIGSRLDLVLTGYAPDKFAREAKKIIVDIDPTELQKLHNFIDLPICVDAKVFIAEFIRQSEKIKPKDRSVWLDRCKGWKTKYPVLLPEHQVKEGSISVYFLTEILSEELSENDIIVPGSAGSGIEIFLLAFKAKSGQRIFNTTALGAMGFGIPAAIGACIASNHKRTVCVDGDGGFQLNIQELETVARLKLPIKFFVLNNGGYASIRASQQKYFGRLTGADTSSGMTLPNVREVASAYDIRTVLISEQRNLRQQVKNVLDIPGPVVCEVIAIPDEPRIPCISSKQQKDGSIVSMPIEDLWPFLEREEFLSNMIVKPLEETYK